MPDIEACARELAPVAEAVLVTASRGGDVLCVVSSGTFCGRATLASEIQAHLGRRLPNRAPPAVRYVEVLPRNAAGEVDCQALGALILDSGFGSRLLNERDVVSVGWLKSNHHPPGELVIPAKAGIHASTSQHLVDMAESRRNMDPRLRGGDERGASSETSTAESRLIP